MIKENWQPKHISVTQMVEVSGAPSMELHYWKGREISPDLVKAVFTRSGQDPWEVRSVEVFGPIVKKDGSKSARQTSSNRWGLNDTVGMPEWLTEILAKAWEELGTDD